MAQRDLEIVNQRGLHARAAAKFVELVEQFESSVTVSKDGQSVPGTSIMGLMMLAASIGCVISVQADGPDADRALDALSGLVSSGFNETD